MEIENEDSKIISKIQNLEDKIEKIEEKVKNEKESIENGVIDKINQINKKQLELHNQTISLIKWIFPMILGVSLIANIDMYTRLTREISDSKIAREEYSKNLENLETKFGEEVHKLEFNSKFGMAINKSTDKERIKSLEELLEGIEDISLIEKAKLYNQLGYHYQIIGDNTKALKNFDKILNLDEINARLINLKIIKNLTQLNDKSDLIDTLKKELYSHDIYNTSNDGDRIKNQDNVNKIIKAYTKLANNKDLHSEILKEGKEFDKVIKMALINKATINKKDDKFEEALEDFNMALEIDTGEVSNRELYNNRGNLYSDMGNSNNFTNMKKEEYYKKALADYKIAIKLDNEFKDTYINLAKSYIRIAEIQSSIEEKEKYYKKALENYKVAILIDPSYKDSYNGRASLYLKIKKYDEALKDYTKFIEINNEPLETNNESLDIYANRGMVYHLIGISKESNKDKNYYYNRALEDYNIFLKDYNATSKIDENTLMVLNNRAEIFLNLKAYKSAVNDMIDILSLDSDFKFKITISKRIFDDFKEYVQTSDISSSNSKIILEGIENRNEGSIE